MKKEEKSIIFVVRKLNRGWTLIWEILDIGYSFSILGVFKENCYVITINMRWQVFNPNGSCWFQKSWENLELLSSMVPITDINKYPDIYK